jgi:hypothetical protein
MNGWLNQAGLTLCEAGFPLLPKTSIRVGSQKAQAGQGADTMRRAIRIAGAIALTLMVAACDKCGDFNINLPKFGDAKACSSQNPQG